MMAAVIASTYLRIFQPLDVFPDAERRRWERFIVQGAPPAPPHPTYRQPWTSERGTLGILIAQQDHADARLIDGTWYVCPWRTRLRVLASLLSLRETMPDEMAEALVPEGEARRAERELARIRRRDPSAVPTMLQSPWHVPVRWFVLVEDEERRLVERDEGGYRLYYQTELPQARKRAEQAWGVLQEHDLGVVGELVRDMAGWLAVFDPRSIVELDYADVSGLFSWNDLDDDHSAREIHEAIGALAEGDLERAGDLYQTVAGRWAEVRIRESLN